MRTSAIPVNPALFSSVVKDGMLVPNGMPRFEEFTGDELAAVRQYIRSQGDALRKK